MLARANGQEVDEWDLHGSQHTDGIPSGVCDIESVAVSSRDAENNTMQGDKVSYEGIATPGGRHPVVEESTQASPQNGALLDSSDPEEVGEDQEENGDGLIIVAASNRSRDVAWCNAHEYSGQETSGLGGGHLIGEEIGREGGKA